MVYIRYWKGCAIAHMGAVMNFATGEQKQYAAYAVSVKEVEPSI
jgi:hypothetical protein